MGSNILLAVYAATNSLVAWKCQGPESTFVTYAVPLFAACELICRNILVYYLDSSRALPTVLVKQEEIYDPDQPLHDPTDTDASTDIDASTDTERLRHDTDTENIERMLDVLEEGSDDSTVSTLSSHVGNVDELIEFSQFCSEDVKNEHTVPILNTMTTISFSAQWGFDSNLFPNIELEN